MDIFLAASLSFCALVNVLMLLIYMFSEKVRVKTPYIGVRIVSTGFYIFVFLASVIFILGH